MDLETVQAALAETERELKKLNNKIAYREKVIAETYAEVGELRLKAAFLTDRYETLVVEERKLKEK